MHHFDTSARAALRLVLEPVAFCVLGGQQNWSIFGFADDESSRFELLCFDNFLTIYSARASNYYAPLWALISDDHAPNIDAFNRRNLADFEEIFVAHDACDIQSVGFQKLNHLS